MRDSIKTAIIGYGNAGRVFHSQLIALAPGLELAGICARDPEARERIRRERGCRAYESFDQVLEDASIDLVVLATPHDTHAPMSIAAMNAGKHVVTDKVMCLSLAECEAMIEASRRTGRMLSVFHNRRWDGDFLTLRKLLSDGTLGDVRWIEMAWQKFGVWKRWRSQRASGGGRLMDLGAHLLDQLLLLNPAPVQSVFCRMHSDFPGVEVESHCLVTLAFADGRTGVCDVGCMCRAPKPRFLAVGSDATFVKHGVDPQEAALHKGDIDAAAEPESSYGRIFTAEGAGQIVPTLAGRWRCFYENIADVLLRGGEPAVKLSEMRRLMRVIDAIFESARTGQAVRLPHEP